MKSSAGRLACNAFAIPLPICPALIAGTGIERCNDFPLAPAKRFKETVRIFFPDASTGIDNRDRCSGFAPRPVGHFPYANAELAWPELEKISLTR